MSGRPHIEFTNHRVDGDRHSWDMRAVWPFDPEGWSE